MTARAARAVTEIDVEEMAVWAFNVQKAQYAARQGMYESELAADGRRVFKASADGCVDVERFGRLGGFIDGGGMMGGACHPDAEAFHAQCEHTAGGVYVLLHGRAGGTRPDVSPRVAPLAPVWKADPEYDGAGRPKPGAFRVEYDANRRPIACLVGPAYDARRVDFELDAYRQWRDALVRLVDHFGRYPLSLRDHRLTGPAAPVDPLST